jgi:hydroxypyruvate isomerase
MNRRRFGQMIAGAAGALALPLALRAVPPTQGVRFSFMIWALTKQVSFDRAMEMVAQAGYKGVELTGQFQKWEPAERLRIMARMRSLGLVFDSMSGVKADFAAPDDNGAFAPQFAQHLRSAKELECSQVIMLSGTRIESVGPAGQRKASIENLKRAAEMAAKEGIEVLIEPIDYLEHPNVYLASVSEGFDLVEAVHAPNLKVLYDLYHEQRSFGNLIEKLEKNIHRVGLVHVADVPGRHEPGTGEIDYGVIYRKLAELKYDRWLAMEFYPTEEPVASLKKARIEAERGLGM